MPHQYALLHIIIYIHASVDTSPHTPISIVKSNPGTDVQHIDTQRVAKQAILGCEMGRFTVRNGPFRSLKWAISQTASAHAANSCRHGMIRGA